MDINRLETARLFHRFGFGPRPGEFVNAVNAGVSATREKLFANSGTDSGLINVPQLVLADLGKRPITQ